MGEDARGGIVPLEYRLSLNCPPLMTPRSQRRAAAAAAAAAEVAAQGGQNMVEKENLALKAELGELRTLKQKLGEEHQKMEHERKAKSDAEAREAELKKRCESLRLEIDRILCDSDSAVSETLQSSKRTRAR